MPKPTAYSFGPKEVMTALLKEAKIHEGNWTLGFNIGIAVSNIGKSPDDQELRPGLIVQVDSVMLNRETPPVPGLTFDAAVLNPKSKKA